MRRALTRAYTDAGVDRKAAAARAATLSAQPMAVYVVRDVLARYNAAVPGFMGVELPPEAGDDYPRGLPWLAFGKSALFSHLGSRYMVVKDSYDLLLALRQADGALPPALGDAQQAWLATQLDQDASRTFLVASSVSMTPMVLDLSHPALDAPPLLRMQGAAYATAVAEYFRDQGLHVLLLMDSLTRYAMAQREIALAIGEPPATKGYPPSCFAKLPQLVERSGNGLNGVGSITAFYTVLSEGDDQQDPIADAARAILDGHIVLSRTLAESGHYPAIDVEASASRVMHNVASRTHLEAARRFRAAYSRYQKTRDLIQLGAYVPGSDPETDQAIALYPALQRFLQQGMFDASTLGESLQGLQQALTPPARTQQRPHNPEGRTA